MNEDLQTVIDAVKELLNDTNLDPMAEAVVNRLVSFGFTPTNADVWSIAFSIEKSVNHVLNQINHSTVPDGLVEITVDMACGEFLDAKFMSGQLDMSGLDLDGIIESIHEGDTTVSFGQDGSDSSKFKDLVNWLKDGRGCDFLCFRKMRW